MQLRTLLALPALLSAALLLTACATAEPPTGSTSGPVQPSTGEALLAEHDLSGRSTVEIIDHLDRLPLNERPTALLASVRHDGLILSDGDRELTLDMPSEITYVSVAPFVAQTHDCYFHSLTGCRGELSEQQIDVRIVTDEGEVLLEVSTTTFDNGFVGFWLPRELSGSIEMTANGRSGSTPFSTAIDAASCITTLQLS